MSPPAWGRELKYIGERVAVKHLVLSPPAWGQDLKSYRNSNWRRSRNVAPRVGAGIEIVSARSVPSMRPVAPRVGAGIEIRASIPSVRTG